MINEKNNMYVENEMNRKNTSKLILKIETLDQKWKYDLGLENIKILMKILIKLTR